ncbi:DUF2254 domain-containing protein [Deinococcus sp. UYEF24]
MTRLLLSLRELGRQFWFIPALMTLSAVLLASLGVTLEERYGVPPQLYFIYGGGEAGARSVLSAVASSSIGLAGTVFSITVAALSFAAGSMGPRLLDNFTRDRGNQVTLGMFIATFAFALTTLRVVRGTGESPFVPHYNVTGALLLAVGCTAALVYFIAHVTRSINITNVVNLLRDDLVEALKPLSVSEASDPETTPPPPEFWAQAEVLTAKEGGYLQLVDVSALMRLAEQQDVALRLLVRPGDYVFPNNVVALGVPRMPEGVLNALVLGSYRTTDQDVEYAVRQLAEVAARALSPGVNDPVTAIDVLDRFGDALCRLDGVHWSTGAGPDADATLRLVRPVTDFAGLTDSMFNMIRQYGKGSPAVMVRLLEVLTAAASCLREPVALAELGRHAGMVYTDALEQTPNSSDRLDLKTRHEKFQAVVGHADPLSWVRN